MTLRVRLFAMLRERAGDAVEIQLLPGATVADALDELALRPELAELLRRLPVRMAVNREDARAGAPLGAGGGGRPREGRGGGAAGGAGEGPGAPPPNRGGRGAPRARRRGAPLGHPPL